MTELSITFKAEITGPFDVEEFSVRFLNLLTARVPIAKGANSAVGEVTVRETKVLERTMGINGNGFVQNGQERLIPQTPCGFKRVLEP